MLCLRVRHCLSVYLCVRVYLYLLYAGLTYLWLYACSTRITLHDITPESDEVLLTLDQKLELEQDISIMELKEALLSMKDNKCPGCDGLPKEFYIQFFDILIDHLISMYHHATNTGRLSHSARTGLISLIPKKEDTTILKNWHPLTLLNLDYKILSKCLARRMKTVLPSMIAEHVTGFMQGRHISENLRKTLDVIQYTKRNKIPAVIMSIDFEKCFDKIEHNAIIGALRSFNFGDKFIQWSKLFLTDFTVATQNFGFVSQPIAKTRGQNQGCCISPFYYLLCGEILSRKISQNPNIKGIPMGDEILHLLSQFTDDTALYLQYDKLTIESQHSCTLRHIPDSLSTTTKL